MAYLLNVSLAFYRGTLVYINYFQLFTKLNHLLIQIHLTMSGKFCDISKVFDKVWQEGLTFKS